MEKGESYGYALIQEIKNRSNNQLQWTDGMLYPVLHRLEAAGLSPNPPATRTAMIRRAYYDMTGLPPSPEEVRAFLAANKV